MHVRINLTAYMLAIQPVTTFTAIDSAILGRYVGFTGPIEVSGSFPSTVNVV